jgi:hypothetical protein
VSKVIPLPTTRPPAAPGRVGGSRAGPAPAAGHAPPTRAGRRTPRRPAVRRPRPAAHHRGRLPGRLDHQPGSSPTTAWQPGRGRRRGPCVRAPASSAPPAADRQRDPLHRCRVVRRLVGGGGCTRRATALGQGRPPPAGGLPASGHGGRPTAAGPARAGPAGDRHRRRPAAIGREGPTGRAARNGDRAVPGGRTPSRPPDRPRSTPKARRAGPTWNHRSRWPPPRRRAVRIVRVPGASSSSGQPGGDATGPGHDRRP